MNGIPYEIQSKEYKGYPRRTYKHTYDYDFCKHLYKKIKRMTSDEFKIHLYDVNNVKEAMHLAEHVLWSKNLKESEYRYQFSDIGMIHLLTHCINCPAEIDKHYKFIHQMFKEEVKLS